LDYGYETNEDKEPDRRTIVTVTLRPSVIGASPERSCATVRTISGMTYDFMPMWESTTICGFQMIVLFPGEPP
jgi:hypothetical protein